MMSPVRTGSPVSGSVTPIVSRRSTRIDRDQVRPLSADRMIRTLNPRSFFAFWAAWNSSNPSTSVPLGSTTISLPIVWFSWPGSKIWRAASHEFPPFVVGEARVSRVGGHRLLVVEDVPVGVADQRDRLVPRVPLGRRPADEDAVPEGRLIEGDGDLVGGAAEPEGNPRIGGALVVATVSRGPAGAEAEVSPR